MPSPARAVAMAAGALAAACLGVAVLAGGALTALVPGAVVAGAPSVAPAATGASPAADVAVAWALARVGTPYRWGGEGPAGFDCSGLVQAAFAAAGISLPRVAQAQYDAGPAVAPAAGLLPGDLVFFGSAPSGVDHVGIVVGRGEMVDAPHTGARVRVEAIWSAGFVGATRPAR